MFTPEIDLKNDYNFIRAHYGSQIGGGWSVVGVVGAVISIH